MNRLNALLGLGLVVSSLYLVNVSYDARRLFIAHEKSQAQSAALAVEHKRLESERQAQATNLRVEKIAREQLAMQRAIPGVTIYVTDPAPAAAEAPQGAPRVAAVLPGLQGESRATGAVR